MKTKVIQGMIPPGGWHYMQDSKYRIESDCFANLVKAVQNWRIENGRPIDDPIKDIEDFICKMSPRNCNLGASPIASVSVINLMSAGTQRMVDNIAIWVVDRSKTGYKTLVSIQDASKRAEGCIKCPMNVKWEYECGPCVTHAQRLLGSLRQHKECDRSEKLHACKIFKHCNRTAVWLKEEEFEKRSDAPFNCWLKK
jgi:hypothetical protein